MFPYIGESQHSRNCLVNVQHSLSYFLFGLSPRYVNNRYALMINLSILKKVTAAAVTENGPRKNGKTNSFGNQIWFTNCLFDEDVQDAFFKDQRRMGAPQGAPIILNLRKFFTD